MIGSEVAPEEKPPVASQPIMAVSPRYLVNAPAHSPYPIPALSPSHPPTPIPTQAPHPAPSPIFTPTPAIQEGHSPGDQCHPGCPRRAPLLW